MDNKIIFFPEDFENNKDIYTYRINMDSIFMFTAYLFALRGTCLRKKVGAVIVKDKRIISTGYVGSPPGADHCIDKGCIIDERTNGCIRTIHAEMNAIIFAAKNGIALKDSSMYVTMSPCINCAKAITVSGITELVYDIKYRNTSGIDYLKENGIKVRQFKLNKEIVNKRIEDFSKLGLL